MEQGARVGLVESLLSRPGLGTAPGQVEIAALAAALLLAGLVFPMAALLFAAANLQHGGRPAPLFASALVSSGLALLLGLAASFLPGALLVPDWRGFLLVFVYAWALLDFWRGARLSSARPRLPAAAAALGLAAAILAAVLVAT